MATAHVLSTLNPERLAEQSYTANSSPIRNTNSNSKPSDAENMDAGAADKAVTAHKSPVSKGVDHSNATIERVTQNVDQIYRMPYVFLHDWIVRRAQLPFPHTISREFQGILNQMNHPNFKFSAPEESMIKIAELMESQQGPAMEQLVARLPTGDDLPANLNAIAREVFFANASDGVFWARLIAVFVFSARIAVQCVKTEAGNYVPGIAVCLQKLIQEHLHSDIERLGGWDAFVTYCNRADQRLVNASPSKSGRLRRFLTQLATVASKGTESEADGLASPQPLTSTVGWFATPISFGASALYDVFARVTEL